MKTRIRAASALLSLVVSPYAEAAPPRGPDLPAIRAAMQKLAPFVGRYKGTGWVFQGKGKHTFEGKERIEFDLDETVLVVRGTHIDLDEGPTKGKVVHQTLGVISYDPAAKNYRFTTWLADGRHQVATAHLDEAGALVWTLRPGGPVQLEFRIMVKNNRWIENGRITTDGKKWRPMLSMAFERQ